MATIWQLIQKAKEYKRRWERKPSNVTAEKILQRIPSPITGQTFAETNLGKILLGKRSLREQLEYERPYLESQARERVVLPPERRLPPALKRGIEKIKIPYTQPAGPVESWKRLEGFIRGEKKPEVKRLEIGKKITPLLSESPETTAIRGKMKKGERLTPYERKRAQEEMMYMVMDVSSGVKPVKSKYASSVNIKKLKLTEEGEEALRRTIDDIKPELQKIKGKTLSHKEVIKEAQRSDILQRVSTRETQKVAEARLLRTRQVVTNISNKIGKGVEVSADEWAEYLDGIRVINSHATQMGRGLESLKIKAKGKPLVEQIVSEVMKVADDTDEVLKAAKGVDFTNTKEATKFYRKFVKPSMSEILDDYRYQNMLSNPRTHLRNAFSNITQTFMTRPATILTTKGPVATAKYYKGVLKGLPQGADDFIKTMKGEAPILKPDLDRLPTRKLPGVMEIPTRGMEAGDKFFSAMIREGELARGASLEEANRIAEYSLFRAALDPTNKEGQGILLSAIDNATAGLYQFLGKAPGGRYIVPFIRTPLNFAKQFIEYSPAGVATIPGASEKKGQLAKLTLGSLVTLIGAKVAWEGNTTLSAPTGETEKRAFYDAGMRPFSFKVGDRWFPYWYLGPFAFAFALPSIVHKYTEGEEMDEETEQKITGAVGDTLKFVVGQTPFTGLNYFVRIIEGDIDMNIVRNMAFTAGQLIPFEGLWRYITTVLDPVYRKPKGFVEQIMSDLPIVSKKIEAYTTVEGEPSKRDISAYIAPYTIGKEKPEAVALLETLKGTKKLRKEATKRSEEEGETAQTIWEEIKGLSYADQRKRLDELEKEGMLNDNIFKRLKTLKKEEKLAWTPAEESIYSLGPVEEARYHWEKIKDMSKEEQREYLSKLEKKGLLTKQTFEELVKLRGGK